MGTAEQLPSVRPATLAQLLVVLRARVLVARAGNADALRWWADEAMADQGQFVLRRLFPRSYVQAGQRLALQAATARYEAALPPDRATRHLFFLGDSLEAALDGISPDGVELPEQPPDSTAALRSLLDRLAGASLPEYVVVKRQAERGMEVALPGLGNFAPHERPDLVALGLAAAACEGELGAPVIPYLRLTVPEPTWR